MIYYFFILRSFFDISLLSIFSYLFSFLDICFPCSPSLDIVDVYIVSTHSKSTYFHDMYNQSIYQGRPDDACVTKVPLPPVQKCQAGAGYSVTPGMVISADLAKSYCASNPMNSLNSEKSDSSDSPSLKPLRLVLEYIFGDAHTELSPLSIARYLERMFSHDDISILQSRINKSLLIEVYNDATYRSLLKLQEINKSPVVIKPKSSVMSKGVFHCEETLDLTENERAQLESQGVIDLYRVLKHIGQRGIWQPRKN